MSACSRVDVSAWHRLVLSASPRLVLSALLIQGLSACLKGMVHLIYKSHLKAVFLCAHYNDAFGFAPNLFGLKVGFQL